MVEHVELSLTECLALLFRGQVGRVGFVTPTGPRLVPVNYSIYHGDVMFRTSPYSELGTHGWDHLVVFEVEELDPEQGLGWSVVARGRCAKVEDPLLLQEIRRSWDPNSWVPGPRHLYLRLAWDDLTGRRIALAPPRPLVAHGR